LTVLALCSTHLKVFTEVEEEDQFNTSENVKQQDDLLPSCTSYTCLKEQTDCIHEYNYGGIKQTVLSPCNSGNHCQTNGGNDYGKCVPTTPYTESGRYPYPGEKFKDYTYCTLFDADTGKKDIGLPDIISNLDTCPGKKESEVCKRDQDCVVGFYCIANADPTLRKCTKLVAKDGKCERTTDCENHLLCYGKEADKKCVENFSLEKDTVLEDGSYEEADSFALCKSTQIAYVKSADGKTPTVKKCVEFTYEDATLKTGELKSCSKESDCKYKEGSFTEDGTNVCLCSKSGSHYCRLPYTNNSKAFDEFKKQWIDYITDTNKLTHTTQRRTPLPKSKSKDKVQKAAKNSIQAADSYKADQCVVDVLSSNYIKISSLLVVLIAFLV